VDANLTIKNYRCFSDAHPLHISLGQRDLAFVGPNNAGKSAILRFFYEFRHLFALSADPKQAFDCVSSEKSRDFRYGDSVKDPAADVFCNSNDRPLTIEIGLSGIPSGVSNAVTRFQWVVNHGTNRFSCFVPVDGVFAKLKDQTLQENGVITGRSFPSGGDLKPLCGLIKELADTVYISSLRNAADLAPGKQFYDLPIGKAFIGWWKQITTGTSSKSNLRLAREVTRQVQSLLGLANFEITSSENSDNLIVSINDKDYLLDEVGAGIAHCIVVFATTANRSPTYLLIDEPELGLHPRLQVSFLMALSSKAKKGALFATHSIGLARSVGDIVYTVTPDQAGSKVGPLEAHNSLVEFLGAMGFSGFGPPDFASILLVEGKHDIKAIRQFLRHFGKDQDTILLPLHGMIDGASESVLHEIIRLCPRTSAIIDSERTAANSNLAPTRDAFVKLCAKLKINCHVLKRRAIENYFTVDSIRRERGSSANALGEFELLPPEWNKERNWRIARWVSREDLAKTDLGDFLGSL
jgi:hypothetical protein